MASNDGGRQPPPGRYSLTGKMWPLAGIAALLLIVAAGFAWAGGWFMPGRLDQNAMVDTFQHVNGVYPGFRRNHAKGVCATGWFEGNGKAAQLSRSPAFQAGRLPVFGRVALAGGMPRVADGPGAVRSIAVNFSLPNGEAWRIGTINIPVFPMKDPQAFHAQLLATAPDPATGKPDPEKVKAFFAANPESARALDIIKANAFSSGFADSPYFGLNAFRLVDSHGASTPVRWSLVPVDAFAPEATPTPTDPNYLFDDLNARIARAPVEWHLVLTVGHPGDPTNDATIPWPADREKIDVGTLTLNAIEPEAPGNCRDINFDPLVLPDGIEPSDDPLLSARSATYSVSFTRRAREAHTPSAVESGAASPTGKGS